MKVPDTLLSFLSKKDSYPHQPDQITHIQTHISHVFIVPPFVYKIKKPVDFGFLDFSTLEKRKKYCKKEVELNRRLCDDVYIGVVPVDQENGSFTIGSEKEPDSGAVEYAVKMNKMVRENFLIGIVKKRELKDWHLEKVVKKLVPFYKNQQPDETILSYGEPEKIKFNTDENFDQTRSYIGETIDKIAYNSIHFFTNEFLKRGEKLFLERIESKHIVDGHGDLHLEHINISEEKLCIYDCIEFNERFRYQDIAADIAFLAMDLDFYRYFRKSRKFISEMAQELNDRSLHRMIDFYKCYRAYVRGKVKSMESSEEEVPENDRKKAAEKAKRNFQLALNYALLGSEPLLLVYMGRVASGKSTLAGQTAEKTGIRHFMTDKIRKTIAGVPETTRLPENERQQLYRPDLSNKTYHTLLKNGISLAKKGESAILDGTFGSKEKRANILSDCKKEGIRVLFIETTAPDNIRSERLKQRNSHTDVISDARLEDMDFLDDRFENPEELNSGQLIRIDTSASAETTLEKLFHIFSDSHLNRLTSDESD